MITGIGTDIIEIRRVKEAIENHKETFLNRLFTKQEQEYCQRQKNPFPCYAGRFSAKEAIVKALGCGFGKEISWKEIEILADENGKPHVHFSSNFNQRFRSPKVLISISHCKEYASAVAIILSDTENLLENRERKI